MNLYVVYLGGKVAEGRMGEDHEVVVVVAPDISAARRAAKAKWAGLGDPHVDSVRLIEVVDGYRVSVAERPAMIPDIMPIDSTWIP